MADIILFFGRFHPVVLHLPIGMLLLLTIYVIASKHIDYDLLKKGLWISLASTALTIIFGLILATEGGYDGSTLMRHKYLGFALFAVQLILIFTVNRPFSLKIIKTLFVLVGVVLTFTGHNGANLTHGENYLFEYISFASISSDSGLEHPGEITDIDSAYVFPQIIYPIFRTNCISCHNQEKQKGNLKLSSFEATMKGSKHGPPVLSGEPALSELLRRIRLPADHPAVMPPDGKQPVSPDEIAIIEWWIKTGAKDSLMVNELSEYSRVKDLIQRVTGATASEVFRISASEVDSVQMIIAIDDGWDIRLLSQGSNALRVKRNQQGADVKSLINIAANIYELDLSEQQIDDDTGELLGKCNNISFLKLRACTSVQVALSGMVKDKLKVLNLNQSDFSDLSLVSGFNKLENLYLLDTQVGQNHIDNYSLEHPDVQVISERFMFDRDNI